MRSGWLLGSLVLMALVVGACSSGVDEARVERLETDVADLDERLDEQSDPRVDDLEERVAELEAERDALRDRVQELEERALTSVSPDGEIEPWPQTVVDGFVEGCTEEESDRPFCECVIGELEDSIPLSEFLTLSFGAVEGEFAELFQNPAFADALGACVFLVL